MQSGRVEMKRIIILAICFMLVLAWVSMCGAWDYNQNQNQNQTGTYNYIPQPTPQGYSDSMRSNNPSYDYQPWNGGGMMRTTEDNRQNYNYNNNGPDFFRPANPRR